MALPIPGFWRALLHPAGRRDFHPGFDGTCRVGIGSDFEWILILQFQKRGNLLQRLRDFRLGHVSPLLKIRGPSMRILCSTLVGAGIGLVL